MAILADSFFLKLGILTKVKMTTLKTRRRKGVNFGWVKNRDFNSILAKIVDFGILPRSWAGLKKAIFGKNDHFSR